MPGRPVSAPDHETGGAATGFLVAVVLLVAVGVAAFFYFGGDANVDIKKPDIHVTSSETPK
jgi:hypothetical protein